jgi:hypothetical protein
MLERDVLIGLIIFGIIVMIADILGDSGYRIWAAKVRFLGLFLLFGLVIIDIVLRKKRQPFSVPIVFTEITDRQESRNMFNSFIQAAKLSKSADILEKLTPVKVHDLIIRLDRRNPHDSYNPQDWSDAWVELLREWQEIDRESIKEPFTTEGRCYHIYPHLLLPLAFALGASVNFRRSLILYHYQKSKDRQDEQYYSVFDLHDPREIIQEDDSTVKPPEVVPSDLDTLPKKDKLILHILISIRIENFKAHVDYQNADNVAMAYRFDLDPTKSWVPYVKQIYQQAKPLIAQYREVEICLMCPSVIAFALGIAFSRTSHLTICQWFDSSHEYPHEYRPIFPLSQIAHLRPFS